MRKRDCSALRKSDMLRLCRLWRYASHVWQPASWPAADREPRALGGAAQGVPEVAAALAALVEQLRAKAGGAPPPALVGYSMGARVALHMALMHPVRYFVSAFSVGCALQQRNR